MISTWGTKWKVEEKWTRVADMHVESSLLVTVDDLSSTRKCTHRHMDTEPGVSPGSDTRHSRPDSGVWCVWCVAKKTDTLTDVTVYYKTQCVYPGSLCCTWCPARRKLASGTYAQNLSSACRKLLQTPGNADFQPRPAGRGLPVRRTQGTSRALRRAGDDTRAS